MKHWLTLCILFSGSLAAFAQPRALVLASGQYGSNTPGVNWTIDYERLEGRIDSFSAQAVQQLIQYTGATQVAIAPNSVTLQCSNGHQVGSNPITIDLTGRTDVRYRCQGNKDNASYLTLEVWNGDGTNYARVDSYPSGPYSSYTVAAQIYVGYSATYTFVGHISFVRYSTSVVAFKSRPPVEAPTTPASRYDYRFENALTDSSGNGYTLTLNTGPESYANSPTYNPVANFGSDKAGIKGGATTALDGVTLSFSSVGNGDVTSCAWVRTSGPGTLIFSAPSSCTTNATTPNLLGTQNVQLTVTDTVGSGVAAGKLGIVPADANDLATSYPNPTTGVEDARMKFALGPGTSSPLTRWNGSADLWPWYPTVEKLDADLIGPAIAQPVAGQTALPGTVGVTGPAGAKIVTCDTTCNFTLNFVAGNLIWIWWNAPGDGKGRALYSIRSVDSNTQMTLETYYVLQPLNPSGHSYSKPNGSELIAWGYGGLGGSNNWNYYDAVMGLYRLYYRTGLDTYLTYARNLADWWWIYGIDHGYGIVTQRVAALAGMMTRALDGRAEMWDGIKYNVDYYANNAYSLASMTTPQTALSDARELGYEQRYYALVARLHPNSAVRTTYCGYVHNGLVNGWASAQKADGHWTTWAPFGNNPDYPYAGDGSFVWHFGIPQYGLAWTHAVMADASYCNNAADAATALTTLRKSFDFTYNYGRGSNRGLYYDVDFYVNGQNPLAGQGTVAANNGSTAIVGSGSSFQTQSACNGTDYIGFVTGRHVYKVMSCADATHLTVDTAWPDASMSGSVYRIAQAATTGCSPSSATYCDGKPGDRNLLHDNISAGGYYYAVTGNTTYKTRGDELFSADYGGTAMHTSANPYCLAFTVSAGPGGDGSAGNFDDPCVYGPQSAQGKQFGFSAGAGAAQTYLAYRLGPADPCLTPTLTPTSASYSAAGGSGSVSFTFGVGGCAWTSNNGGASWITVTSGASGTGNGSTTYTVAANTGPARNATVSIAGVNFPVHQTGAGAGTSNSTQLDGRMSVQGVSIQ